MASQLIRYQSRYREEQLTEKVREYNSITQCFDEFEYVESWDGAVRHPGNEDMFWYDMELFAEDDEESTGHE